MSRRFELLKDWGTSVKAGRILEWYEDGKFYRVVNDWMKTFPQDIVECDSKYFREIKDTEQSSVFNEKLINERLAELVAMERGFNIAMSGKYKTFLEYQKSQSESWQTPTEQSSMPFEFEEGDAHWLGIVASITNEKHLPTAANFLRKQMNIVLKSKQKGTANDVLRTKDNEYAEAKERYDKMKNAIPQPNSEGKDWEIVLMSDAFNAKMIKGKEGMFRPHVGWGEFSPSYIIENGGRILSVKRLSDGEVFSVGDEVTRGNKFGIETIKKFEADGNRLLVHFNENVTFSDFDFVTKPQPQQESKRIDILNNFKFDGVEWKLSDDTYHKLKKILNHHE